MKVSAGLIGLTQNQEVLNRFCLIAPILSSLTYNHLEKLLDSAVDNVDFELPFPS